MTCLEVDPGDARDSERAPLHEVEVAVLAEEGRVVVDGAQFAHELARLNTLGVRQGVWASLDVAQQGRGDCAVDDPNQALERLDDAVIGAGVAGIRLAPCFGGHDGSFPKRTMGA